MLLGPLLITLIVAAARLIEPLPGGTPVIMGVVNDMFENVSPSTVQPPAPSAIYVDAKAPSTQAAAEACIAVNGTNVSAAAAAKSALFIVASKKPTSTTASKP